MNMNRYRPRFNNLNMRLQLQHQQSVLPNLNMQQKSYGKPIHPLILSPPCTTRNNIMESIKGQRLQQAKLFNQKQTQFMNANIPNSPTIIDGHSQPENNNNQCQLPLSPKYVLNNMSNLLFDFEKIEIQNYSEIYYVRQTSPKMRIYSSIIPNFFQFVQNDHIAYRYQQLELMGKGAFGSVIKCYDHKNKRQVAVKMIRDQPKYHDQTRLERNILKELQGCSRVVRFLKSFTFRGFFCIVNELLYKDAYTILKTQRYYGFNMMTLQNVARQLAESLAYTHQKGIIHCDVKPENVMFTNPRKIGIKLVDFGCSCYIGKTVFTYIQSRYFRAPEIVLSISYGPEIDVWSYACVLVELLTGKPLFPASNEHELMEMVISLIGNPPPELLKNSKRGDKFFDKNGKIKPLQFGNSNVQALNKKRVKPLSQSLEKILHVDEKSDSGLKELCDLVQKCLKWIPSERITMEQALNHPFMTSTTIRNNASPLPPLSVR